MLELFDCHATPARYGLAESSAPMIKYIQFPPGVSVSVGTFKVTSMDGYSMDKHAKEMDVEELPTELLFWLKKDGKRTGERIRMSKTGCAIREIVETKPRG